MLRCHVTLFFIVFSIGNLVAQRDSLQLGDKYWEDQLYVSVTYNTLLHQPSGVNKSGFSYGISVGYIKDIPLNKRGNWAAGIGIGYNYDSFSHGLIVDIDDSFLIANNDVSSNKIRLHTIEFPFQLRWRASDAITYSFWRIYAGVRLNYNISNTFKYRLNDQNFSFKNISSYNKFQAGIELSVGYGAFNLFAYYGLTPIYNTSLNENKIDTRIAKFGLIFYIL